MVGVFIAVCGLWIPGFIHAIWRASLSERAAGLAALGLEIHPGIGPKIRAYGIVDGRRVRVRLKGGLRGERYEVHAGPEHHSGALEQDPVELVRELLGRS